VQQRESIVVGQRDLESEIVVVVGVPPSQCSADKVSLNSVLARSGEVRLEKGKAIGQALGARFLVVARLRFLYEFLVSIFSPIHERPFCHQPERQSSTTGRDLRVENGGDGELDMQT